MKKINLSSLIFEFIKNNIQKESNIYKWFVQRMFHRGEKSSMMLMGKRKNGEEWGDAARSLAVLLNSSSIDENAENRTRPPRNLHLCLANAAQGDIVVTMKPPSPPMLAIPPLDTHSDTAMSCAGVALELLPRTRCAKLREFWSRIHHGTANKKNFISLFSPYFLSSFSPTLLFFYLFLSLFFFFLVLVFELSLRTPDNAKILLKQSRERRPKLAPEKI